MQDSVPPLPTEWVQSVTSQKTRGGRQGNSCIVSVALVGAIQYLSSRAFLTDKAQGIRIQHDFCETWVSLLMPSHDSLIKTSTLCLDSLGFKYSHLPLWF